MIADAAMRRSMPPRSSLTSSFSVTDSHDEVVCPLKNHDGSSCRKRCVGEKRYRSMQEHIRRAHPENYIPKLPATEESFLQMINIVGDPRPRLPPQAPPPKPRPLNGAPMYHADGPGSIDRRPIEDHIDKELPPISTLPTATAAATLASLHHYKLESSFESEPVSADFGFGFFAHKEQFPKSSNDFDSPRQFPPFPHLADHPNFDSSRPRTLLPSVFGRSPPNQRMSSLPPPLKPRDNKTRPRKTSITNSANKPRHERQLSRGDVRRLSLQDGRKAFSAEPESMRTGNRWEDLIDAATTATEVPEPLSPLPKTPPLRPSSNRSSLPPSFLTSQHLSQSTIHHSSPLQHQLNYPSPHQLPALLPSIEQIDLPPISPIVQILCSSCRRTLPLKDALACCACICGLCIECVDSTVEDGQCPVCSTVTVPTDDEGSRRGFKKVRIEVL